jgi:hypothetical protein
VVVTFRGSTLLVDVCVATLKRIGTFQDPVMDFFHNPAEIMSFSSTLLFLLLSANRALDVASSLKSEEEVGTIIRAITDDPL